MLPRYSTILIVGALVLIGVVAYRFGNLSRPTGTYDECVVNEMRGQSIFMGPAVEKTCARRFGLVFDITSTLAIPIDWKLESNNTEKAVITLKVRPNASEWVVTKARVTYANRKCDAQPPLQENEFRGNYIVDFTGERATLTLPSNFFPPGCQRVMQLWARYR